MITIQDAIEIIKKFDKFSIPTSAFEYDDVYLVYIKPKDPLLSGSIHPYMVDKNGQVGLFDFRKAYDDMDGFIEARRKEIIITEN